MIFVYSLAAVALSAFIAFLATKPRQQTGMSPRGGRRIKNALGFLLIRSGRKRSNDTLVPELVNRRVPVPAGESETDYNDSFVFQGSDERGNLFMTRLGFRDGGKSAELWVWTALEGAVYANVIKTVQCDPPVKEGIAAAGLTYVCEDERKGIWAIAFDGDAEPGNISCKVRLRWEPRSAMYHSGVHSDSLAFARAMAEMPWSRTFFDNLKSESQTRIEQGGTLSGTVTVAGRTHDISMIGVRDHSWGKRSWSFINRYIWNILSFTKPLERGGKTYDYLCYTTVDYGTSFECLVSGWIAGKDSVIPIVAATNQKDLGEDGNIPKTIRCFFQPKGWDPVPLTINRGEAEYSWFMGAGDFEVCEAYCTFDAGGRIGVGMSEFGYSKQAGYSGRFPKKSED